MKQVVRVHDRVEIREVPLPSVKRGFAVIQTEISLISTGSETRALRDSRGLLKKVIDTTKRALATKEAASNMGYSCAGRIRQLGDDVPGLSVGDLVLCSGFDYAIHAESICVPKNLIANVPQGVSAAQATFATLGSVSLHALRRAQMNIGETALVVGLGLTGQLLVQLLRLQGCNVFCVDPNRYKIDLAKKHGATASFCGKRDYFDTVKTMTQGIGVDAAFVCYDLHESRDLEEITRCIRERGRLIAVGNITCSLPFSNFFRKELDLIVSRSFGPGRFDPSYEEGGTDYPMGYVRWTEGRNIKYILELLSAKKLIVDDLVDAAYPVADAQKAYASLFKKRRPIAILLTY